MSYTIQGIIGDWALLTSRTIAKARFVSLPQNKALLPFSSEFRSEHALPWLPLTDEGSELPEKIQNICTRLSVDGRLAYVEAEFFGGLGTQAAVVWTNGIISGVPMLGPNAIDQALRSIGVIATKGVDEFDTLGLGRHRDIEGWLGE